MLLLYWLDKNSALPRAGKPMGYQVPITHISYDERSLLIKFGIKQEAISFSIIYLIHRNDGGSLCIKYYPNRLSKMQAFDEIKTMMDNNIFYKDMLDWKNNNIGLI